MVILFSLFLVFLIMIEILTFNTCCKTKFDIWFIITSIMVKYFCLCLLGILIFDLI